MIDIVEVSAKSQFMEQAGSARAIRVPSAPHAFAIALLANDQTLKCVVVETKLTASTQSLNGSYKNQIRRA